MSPAEYNAYNSAISQTDAAGEGAGARGLSDCLSAVGREGRRAAAADAGVQPDSIRPRRWMRLTGCCRWIRTICVALTLETYFRKAAADQMTDAAAKQAALDKAADYAQKGLAAPKPAEMSDADFIS